MKRSNSLVKKLVAPEDQYTRNVIDAPLVAFEPDLSFLSSNYLSKSSVYIDIGVNIGATVVHIAKQLSQGRVYCFEPTRAYDFLQ